MQHEKDSILNEMNLGLYIKNVADKNLIPIVNQLLYRCKELQKIKDNLLNVIKNKSDLITKRSNIEKIKLFLKLFENENKEFSNDKIKEIMEMFYPCLECSYQEYNNNNNNSSEVLKQKNNEIDIKNIIAECLLSEMTKPNYCGNKQHDKTNLNNYVVNSLSRKGYNQSKQEQNIRIKKNRDSKDINNHIFGEITSRPQSNISSSHHIVHSDTLTSYLIMENSKGQGSLPQIQIPQSQKEKKLVHRNNHSISQNNFGIFPGESGNIQRSMSSLSKVSRIETTKEILSKKNCIEDNSHVNINKDKIKYSVSSGKKMNRNKDSNHQQTNNNNTKVNVTTKALPNKNNENKVRRQANSASKKRYIKKISFNHNNSRNIILNNKCQNIFIPSMLSDYNVKKEKTQTKVKLSCLIHVLSKLFKIKFKELSIDCFYDLLLFNKQKIRFQTKKNKKSKNKLTLKTLLRKYIVKNISFSLKTITQIYNKKKKKFKFERVKPSHRKNLSYINSQFPPKNNSDVSEIRKLNSHKRNITSHRNKSQNEELMIYMPNLQYDGEEYEVLIQEPVIMTNEINDNSHITIGINDCIHTNDEIINKKSMLELLEEQENQLDKNELFINNQETTIKNKPEALENKQNKESIKEKPICLDKNNKCSIIKDIKLDEDEINVSEPSKSNDYRSAPVTPVNKFTNFIEKEPTIYNIKNEDINPTLNDKMDMKHIKKKEIDSEEEKEGDCHRYYDGLHRLQQLNEETKQIEANMKEFLESV